MTRRRTACVPLSSRKVGWGYVSSVSTVHICMAMAPHRFRLHEIAVHHTSLPRKRPSTPPPCLPFPVPVPVRVRPPPDASSPFGSRFPFRNSLLIGTFFPIDVPVRTGSERGRFSRSTRSKPPSLLLSLGFVRVADQRPRRRINFVRRDGVCVAFRHGQRSGTPRRRRRDPRQASAGTQVRGARSEGRRSRPCSCTHVDGRRKREGTKRRREGAHVADAGRGRRQEKKQRKEKRC